ncbi:hypothetical protein XELAEV_18046404mg [Xenopus laevis]|uniref:Uncharacterized protein n=1 Tax=Xenopus laevis TaxID=8355 RepID=A0A974BT88_XENLA|nr:hypothetical protein XELAEV_18046404mg [Xenopus laevis]
MEDYEAQQIHIGKVLDTLLSRMTSVSPVASNPQVTSVASSAGEPRISPPPRYSGDPQACRGLVTQCLIEWTTPLWKKNSPLTILQAFCTVFDAPGRVTNASSRLLQIQH